MEITALRSGMKVELAGKLYVVVSAQHVSPGNKRAFVRARIKDLKTGQLLEQTVREGNEFRVPDFDDRTMQYLYKDAQGYHFMDNENYEQTFLSEEQVGDNWKWLQENTMVKILYHNGLIISLDIPLFAELVVTETDPGFKGDTASTATKAAKLTTGASIQVPLFVAVGDKLKIDTRTGEYLARV